MINGFPGGRPETWDGEEFPEIDGVNIRQPGQRKVQVAMGEVDLLGIPMRPGDPGYGEKIPPPAPLGIATVPIPASPLVAADGSPLPMAPPPAVSVSDRILTIRPGRGETTFILELEETATRRLIDSFRMEAEILIPALPLLRAIGVEISDRTVGELKDLEIEYAELEQDSRHTAARARSSGARAKRPLPAQPKTDQRARANQGKSTAGWNGSAGSGAS